MKTLVLTFLFLLTGTISFAAYADCIYQSRAYPTGTTRGPYICMPNGTWQRR